MHYFLDLQKLYVIAIALPFTSSPTPVWYTRLSHLKKTWNILTKRGILTLGGPTTKVAFCVTEWVRAGALLRILGSKAYDMFASMNVTGMKGNLTTVLFAWKQCRSQQLSRDKLYCTLFLISLAIIYNFCQIRSLYNAYLSSNYMTLFSYDPCFGQIPL